MSRRRTSLSSMTLPTSSTLSARIAAASAAHPILRRAFASQLYAEMAKLPDSIGLAADWRALSRLLLACEVELYPRPHTVPPVAGDMDRALEFAEMGRKAYNHSVLMGVRVKGKAMRKGKRAPRVIDATCEVRS